MSNLYEEVIGFFVVILIISILWVLPIWFGVKWAKIKGVSKLWMLFGIHPMTGWIAYLVLKYGIDPRWQCNMCKESIKIGALICRYCGNKISQDKMDIVLKQLKKRKE